MPDADFELVRPYLRHIDLKKGELLRQQGGASRSVCFPVTGVISTIIYLSDGRSVEAGMAGSEGMADISALGTGVSFGDHLVQGTGVGFTLPASHLARAMIDSAAVSRMVCLASEISTAYSLQSLVCLNYHPLEARFSRWMLMTRYHLQRDDFEMTHEFLAAMLGAQRSSVSLVAKQLQQKGLIEYRRGSITIADVAGLKAKSCECYKHVTSRFERAFPRPSGFQASRAG